jgi:hypothetical protein
MANNKLRLFWKIGLTFIVSLCFYFPIDVLGLSVGVTPTHLEVSGAPGDVITDYFDVIGEEKANSRILSYVGDWDLDAEGHVRFINKGGNPRSASDWVKISPTDFPIPAGNKRRVQVTVTIPKDAEGEYWTMAFFESRSNTVLNKTGVNMAGRIANAIYVLVNRNLVRKATITGMSCFWSPAKGFQGRVRVENRGNVRVFPRGRLEIRNAAGKTVQTVPVEPQQVLPGLARIFTVKKDITLKKGNYVVLAIFDYDGEKLVAAQCGMKVVE